MPSSAHKLNKLLEHRTAVLARLGVTLPPGPSVPRSFEDGWLELYQALDALTEKLERLEQAKGK
jgi:hypothetical protein